VIRALVTGARGQVGAELVRALAGRAEVAAHDRASLDLADRDAIVRALRDARPDLILNAGAYTAVDRAESEAEAARAVNGVAPAIIADEAKRLGALLVHFSTDYVYDGTKPSPYVESDPPNPLGVYGRTKLEGDDAVAQSGCDHVILRTSWVYAPFGSNFMLTMLKLAATRDELRVVDDQHGAPTSGARIARAVTSLLMGADLEREIAAHDIARARESGGVYHATAEGATTWFEFAQAIFAERARSPGHAFTAPRLIAIPAREYPTAARRPANSRLDCTKLRETFGVRLGPWRDGLREAMSAIA
jgi:dTDP-4-dehydrorhamnose reductase